MSLSSNIIDGAIDSCYALDDGSALHFKNGNIHSSIRFYNDANTYQVRLKDGKLEHHKMLGISLLDE